MKMFFISLIIMLPLTSCKSKASDSDVVKDVGPNTQSRIEENQLVETLINERQLEQREFIKKILKLNQVTQGTIKRLDRKLEIICERELCGINQRNIR